MAETGSENPHYHESLMFKKTAILTTVSGLGFVSPGYSVTLVNGGFETLIGDTGDVTISSSGFTQSPVGPDMPLQSGTYSDGSDLADLVGWVGNNNVSVVAAQSPRTGSHAIALNGSAWGNAGGATEVTTLLSDSIGVAGSTPITISLWAQGSDFPVAFDLLADGVALTASSAVSPTLGAAYQEFTRSYDSATMTAVSGADLTIQFGLEPTGAGTGGQVRFDDVSATAIPEPSSLALLTLGGLLIARHRRS